MKKGVITLVFVILIGVVVAASIYLFNVSELDTRVEDVKILNNRLVDCFVDGGVLEEGVLDENYDVIEGCGLNRGSFGESGVFFFEVRILKESDGSEVKVMEEGNSDLEILCELESSKGKLSVCYNGEVYARGVDEGVYIEILTASNNKGGSR